METLDEVIKNIEAMWVCPSSDGADEYCELMSVREDALHYLKEYRTTQTAYIKAMADLEDNPPLTWDELKGIVGKPVWVEWISGTWKGLTKWAILNRIDDDYLVFTASDVAGQSYNGHLRLINLGKTWQAYRKERE